MNIFIAHIDQNTAILNAEESWHCCKVLRKKSGDKVRVIDGHGLMAEGNLDLVSEKTCSVKLSADAVKTVKHPYYLHLAIAPTKQIDRIEWMVEKAVEIGIDEISFLHCKNSERVHLKTERIQKIIESAVKQSLQAYIPKVNALQNFAQFIGHCKADQILLAHCEISEKTDISQIAFKEKHSIVMIGPEGDFAPDEIKMAEQLSCKFVSLGENRLRTETAGLYATMAAAMQTRL